MKQQSGYRYKHNKALRYTASKTVYASRTIFNSCRASYKEVFAKGE